jgi:hypothetical protein
MNAMLRLVVSLWGAAFFLLGSGWVVRLSGAWYTAWVTVTMTCFVAAVLLGR